MTRGARAAAFAGLAAVAVAVGLTVAVRATSGPEPQPTPTRVYSSCLAADTRPLAADDDPCEGPGR
ncbi:hypothetical protein [Streptomyces sp. NPDC102360]|uniref:hypothetical protein n=1 Tax=Streptomyces sp. NPDC102360 TaxID=3366160 RepID=UPI0037F62B12